MIYGGVCDQFPDLRVIPGHFGEALAFWLYRIQAGYEKQEREPNHRDSIGRPPAEYVRENVWGTTGGAFSTPLFLATMMEVGSERILFGSDDSDESLQIAVDSFNNCRFLPGIGSGSAPGMRNRS